MILTDRIELFLKYQNENMSFEDISNKLEVKPTTLRRSLNKAGYKSDKGKYIKMEEVDKNNKIGSDSQISFEDINNKSKIKPKSTKKEISKKETAKKNKFQKETVKKADTKKTMSKKVTPKKDKKINISQEDLDKLCEVYDWYIEVKDNKALRPKKLSNKKDIVIEDENIKDIKSVNVRVDKGTWEEFERLCSNSSYSKKEIVTQALKDFMKAYKSLL